MDVSPGAGGDWWACLPGQGVIGGRGLWGRG